MLNKQNMFVVISAVLMLMSVPILAALGEERLTVFMSIFILEYFILSGIISPKRWCPDLAGALLFLIFSYIVAVKIMEVLGW